MCSSIVCLFQILLRFPSHQSAFQVILNCYGNKVVKLTWMFEWMDFRYRKMLLDLDFVNNYIRNVAVPKFFQFRVANKGLCNSSTYRQCQAKLLKQEISRKTRRARLLKEDLQSTRSNLMSKLKWIDFKHLFNLFLLGNDETLPKHCVKSIEIRSFSWSVFS